MQSPTGGFKLQEAVEPGPSIGLCKSTGPTETPETMKLRVPPGLFGKPTESEVLLEGTSVKALLDSGSTVSTVSRTFYQHHLVDLEMHSIQDLLDIECAGGQQLPYDGYIEAQLKMENDSTDHPCLLLVVPDTPYNTHVPVLLGTNILTAMMDSLKQHHGNNYLQTCQLKTPW